jgi:FAD dependent oxidoreductase
MNERASIPVSLPCSSPVPSYWHSNTPLNTVPHPISSLRSTEHLPEYADYIIVGSGISGAMIAWGILDRLEKAGDLMNTKVLMLEARGAVGGATGRNGKRLDTGLLSMLSNMSCR